MCRFDSDFMEAEDWKAMYMMLHHAIEDALDRIGTVSSAEIAEILIKGLAQAEEHYVAAGGGVQAAEEQSFLTQAEIDAVFGIE